MRSSILIIYTGGTIGMKTDAETGALVPFDFSGIYDEFPSLKRLNVDIDVLTMSPVIDSSNVEPSNWAALAGLIRDNYARYDGFVVLHGTDTMSYTASALSFMLENLAKPVVFTGSQIPIGVLRTDGRENLITAIEIAGAQRDGRPVVPEVSLYFQNRLFRANRTSKRSAEALNAFCSDNYPPLAEVGVNIAYNLPAILRPAAPAAELRIATRLARGIARQALPGARRGDPARGALGPGTAGRRARNLRRGERPDLRVVHPPAAGDHRPRRDRAEHHPVRRRTRLDGALRNRTAAPGNRRPLRLRHDLRGRRHQTHVRTRTGTPPRRDRTAAAEAPAGRIYGLNRCTEQNFFLYFALLMDPFRAPSGETDGPAAGQITG